MADDINVVVNLLSKYKDISFVGDGAVLHQNILTGQFVTDNNIHAENVGICGFKKYNTGILETADSIKPMYLRKSQAERMRDSK